ncbi:MAG: AbrB/MazE/SpoVT family DNA-binding domain-containing protein [Firmicutes bacterium]|nr:AbrB/MazE/SpoVT family DNA-binding domain-containing protein [Bacillota bacterium]
MKPTGVVRRIDDLGRIVIPKEIRRTLRIHEGDPLEIFTDREGEVIFRKYNMAESNFENHAEEYAESLHQGLNCVALIANSDSVIAVAGISKRKYVGKTIGTLVKQVMEGEGTGSGAINGQEILADTEIPGSHYVISTVYHDNQPIGAIILISDNPITQAEITSAKAAASFLQKQAAK